jgi:hypothetical protein
MEMPSMQRLATALKDRSFRLLAVNVWDVQIYPTSYLIDADGRMRYVAYGPVDWDSGDIIRRIEALLPAGKAVQQVGLD